MNRTISTVAGHAYTHAIKPILFRQAPDRVHERMIKSGSHLQRVSLLRRAAHGSFAYTDEAVLGQDILGIHFSNPVGLSAGLDKNFKLVPMMKAIGFGFMEGGSLTYQPCPGNERPWFHRLPENKSLVVHVGLANEGVEAITNRLKAYSPQLSKNFPLNISVAKTNSRVTCDDTEAIADYIGSLRALKAANVGTMYTLNISCPNTYGGEPFTTAKRLDALLQEIDSLHLSKPVFIKMPIDLTWAEFKELGEVAAAHHIAGLTIGNLAKKRTPAINKELPNHIKGNLSGKPTQELSNQLIKLTRRHFGDRFVLIGVGGIFSAKDAYAKIKYGADLVELITGVIFQGPQLIGQINRELAQLVQQDGYHTIRQAVGTWQD